MKRSFNLSRVPLALVTIAAATLTSCNRGVGCPTNFSLNEVVQDVVSVFVSLL